MVFADVLKSLPDPDRAEVVAVLSFLESNQRIGMQVCINLQSEKHLPHDSALDILSSLRRAAHNNESAKKTYEDACHRNVLKGDLMRGARPLLLGRVVTVDEFVNWLTDQYFPSESSARMFINSLQDMSLSEIKIEMSHINMARHLVWATYNEEDRVSDPFDSLPYHNPDLLQDALGLPSIRRGRDVFLFTYSPTHDLELRFPTVADAGWNDNFRPASNLLDQECGKTFPTLDHPEVHAQPELVHRPVSCMHLEKPLRFISVQTQITI